MENKKQNKMGTMPILKLVVSMSLPAMFSMLIQAMYNIVDSIFVSRLGEDALTAVSLAFPIQILMIAIAVGTGIGINSLISRRLGEGNREEANSAATHGILLGVFNGLLFALLGILFSRAFFNAFTDDLSLIDLGYNYAIIVTTFSIGIFIQITIEKTLQATGNMLYPMISQLIGAVINIILDPILIFGLLGLPALGIKGAAIATVIGQNIAMLFALFIILKKSHEVKISFNKFKLRWKIIKQIYIVGFPSIIMQSITSFLIFCLNAILKDFSDSGAVAVLGIYYKLQSFIFMPVFGMMQGIMPIIGFNYGAKNKERVINTIKTGILIATLIMLAGTIIFMAIPDKMLMIFNASPKLLETGIIALRIISISFIFAAGGIIMSTFFQAIGQGRNSLYISILRQVIVILPVAYFMSKIGLNYVWIAFPISEIVACIASFYIFSKVYNNKIKNL